MTEKAMCKKRTLPVALLARNGFLYGPDGQQRVSHNALAALTLMVAMSSDPKEKDLMTALLVRMVFWETP